MKELVVNMRKVESQRESYTLPTYFERRLWDCLRERRLRGFRFRKQVTIGPYIVDFLCHEARLIVELDGAQHFEQAAYDMQRTRYLERCGFHVLRFWNSHTTDNLESVLHEIDVHLFKPQ